MSRIVLGVAGGIAAYKACELLRRLREAGHDITVVPTHNALTFVGQATWEALSGHPVHTGVFEATDVVNHVRLGREADLVVVAPATADLLARAATGRADDLLTNVLLTASCPVLMCPAMHTEMWQHPATVANVATLRSRGTLVVDPASGRLTGADSGPGRLPEPAELAQIALSLLEDASVAEAIRAQDLRGLRVAVSAGGTHEALDPVRFLGNASSGRMGIALAQAARLRGAAVTLVCANVELPRPAGVTVENVVSTGDLARAMERCADDADVIIMAAAPADFTPSHPQAGKIKKDELSAEQRAGWSLDLRETTDVLATLSAHRRPGQVIVGFAAETASDRDHLVELGVRKLDRKGCDAIVCNDVSEGKVFGADDNQVVIVGPQGIVATARGSKPVVAHHIVSAVTGAHARA